MNYSVLIWEQSLISFFCPIDTTHFCLLSFNRFLHPFKRSPHNTGKNQKQSARGLQTNRERHAFLFTVLIFCQKEWRTVKWLNTSGLKNDSISDRIDCLNETYHWSLWQNSKVVCFVHDYSITEQTENVNLRVEGANPSSCKTHKKAPVQSIPAQQCTTARCLTVSSAAPACFCTSSSSCEQRVSSQRLCAFGVLWSGLFRKWKCRTTLPSSLPFTLWPNHNSRST